jgi:hypothetical protein
MMMCAAVAYLVIRNIHPPDVNVQQHGETSTMMTFTETLLSLTGKHIALQAALVGTVALALCANPGAATAQSGQDGNDKTQFGQAAQAPANRPTEDRGRMMRYHPYRARPVYPYGVPGGRPYGNVPYGRGPYEFLPYNGDFPATPAGQ